MGVDLHGRTTVLETAVTGSLPIKKLISDILHKIAHSGLIIHCISSKICERMT